MKITLFWAVVCLAIVCGKANPITRSQIKPVDTVSKEESKQQSEDVIAKGKILEDTTGVYEKETKLAKTSATEIDSKEHDNNEVKATGRQSTAEDDDDDDDDLDLGVDDDDDDDDDTAADDDDDDDYFESFFDDILGEDDDDDDDEPASSPAASQPAEAVQEVAQETAESAVEEAEEAVDSETSSEGTIQEQSADEPIGEKDPTDINESSQNTVEEPLIVDPVPVNDQQADEDDDEDDDDDGLDLADDDDDDDDTVDDDDDDDDDFEDVLEVKRSHTSTGRSKRITLYTHRDRWSNKPPPTLPKQCSNKTVSKKLGALQSGQSLPSSYITKYNRFVDTIIGRINRILMKSYDPVRVKLQAKTSTKTKSTTKRRKSNKKKNSSTHADKSAPRVPPSGLHKMGNYEIARSIESESREPPFVLISKAGAITSPYTGVEGKAKSNRKNTRKSNKKRKNNKGKNNSNSSNNKNKQDKAKATLFGLSSIRREGDVAVNMMADHTTVKTSFIIGPLTLRVEKEFGKGERRELKSATATTTEMHGKLILRIVNGGAATLHSIKVLQPKQVRIESKEDHDKTHEYIWKKSSHIADVVSQKLATATKSMLEPPPHP